MSIFGSIMSRIFGRSAEAAPTESPAEASVASQATPTPSASPSAVPPPSGAAAPASPATAGGAGTPAQPQAAPVDVEAVLEDLAAKNPQKLDWRHSIVDLMKLLNLDSSLDARRELARELNYTGSTSDTAAMNIWLHKQVMKKLAENGGRVPDSLRS